MGNKEKKQIELNRQVVEQVNNFNYFGTVMLWKNGKVDMEITENREQRSRNIIQDTEKYTFGHEKDSKRNQIPESRKTHPDI